ncbi:hypothetical protein GPALN_005338 [Globodera pallida]|nr:hypothetical protein GPALN_005338 [Globodera pallida]
MANIGFCLSRIQMTSRCFLVRLYCSFRPLVFMQSELYSAASVYGIHAKHVHFVDPEEQTFRDGFFDWNVTSLSASIYAHIKRSRPNGLITFDEWGISGHPNHISCFRAIHNLKGRRKAQ